MSTRTTKQLPEAFASQGAVRQNGGLLPIYTCNGCGHDVVWATSRRTDRKYLVNVTRGYLDQRFYMGNNVHTCPEPEPAPVPEDPAVKAERQARARRSMVNSIEGSQAAYEDGRISERQYGQHVRLFVTEYLQDVA